MPQTPVLTERIFSINNDSDFNALAIEIFRFQLKNNLIYQKFVEFLSIDADSIDHYSQIPFLPIEFFKTQKVISGEFTPEVEFTSSGTSRMNTSKHLVKEKMIYEKSFSKAFELFFGQPEEYVILALLPSYLERGGSSLVFMVDWLIKNSRQAESGFYLNNHEELFDALIKLRDSKKKVLLIGVSYALLDLAENFPLVFPDLLIMETGGMKGMRKEVVRSELHETLKSAYHTKNILSEYGMTELLSQAYSMGDGIFSCPPWMNVIIRDPDDPLSAMPFEKIGGINIIDLANFYSCSFIATQDLGSRYLNGTFEVLGRFDNSDVRGCNLMIL